jgi:hypothetical protein
MIESDELTDLLTMVTGVNLTGANTSQVEVQRFWVQRRRWPEKRPVKSNKKLNERQFYFSDRINRMDRI